MSKQPPMNKPPRAKCKELPLWLMLLSCIVSWIESISFCQNCPELWKPGGGGIPVTEQCIIKVSLFSMVIICNNQWPAAGNAPQPDVSQSSCVICSVCRTWSHWNSSHFLDCVLIKEVSWFQPCVPLVPMDSVPVIHPNVIGVVARCLVNYLS